nr:GTPase ObgE [Desulfobulbaceae bacterium]
MAFIDETKFFVKGGDGGRGCVSFRREKFVPLGGPDGGDGGDAGSVYLVASKRLRSLLDFKQRSHFIAKNGGHGVGKKMHGKGGKDIYVSVPLGSVIKDADTKEILVDMIEDGQEFLAAQGGHGGRGNVHFASSQNRAPRRATAGTPGEERWLYIELKLLADVGLIGLPNAGKSTLLSKLSAANPKIAAYPFTTLEPQLGMLQFDHIDPLVIADIPGLIKGAHEGAGLGHKFLRHIERTKVLLHVLDVSTDFETVCSDFLTIENELFQYKEELATRHRIVILNKMDELESSDQLTKHLAFFAEKNITALSISALMGEGIDELKEKLAEIFE